MRSLIFIVILFSGRLFADEYHYRNILIGEQASGLGGAYVAISDDPSGVYYNPAGIVFGMENYFSMSVTTYTESTRTYKNVLSGMNYTYTSQGFVPTFFGLTQNVGNGKWGFAMVIPNQDMYNQTDSLTGLSTGAGDTNTLNRRFYDSDWTFMVGPAYSREVIKDHLTIGVSLFGVYRQQTVIDNQTLLFNGGRYVDDEHTIDQATYGLYPKIGLQYMPVPKWSIGWTVAKTFTVQSHRHTHLQDIDSNNGTNPMSSSTDDSPNLISPIEETIGVAFFSSKRSLYTADLLYDTADSSFADYSAQATWNVSVGTEQYISEQFILRFGLFTNNSNTPSVVAGNQNQPDHVDLYGATGALSFRSPGSSVTLGTSYSFGTGKGQPIGGSTAINDISETHLNIYLVGSYQL